MEVSQLINHDEPWSSLLNSAVKSEHCCLPDLVMRTIPTSSTMSYESEISLNDFWMKADKLTELPFPKVQHRNNAELWDSYHRHSAFNTPTTNILHNFMGFEPNSTEEGMTLYFPHSN